MISPTWKEVCIRVKMEKVPTCTISFLSFFVKGYQLPFSAFPLTVEHLFVARQPVSSFGKSSFVGEVFSGLAVAGSTCCCVGEGVASPPVTISFSPWSGSISESEKSEKG